MGKCEARARSAIRGTAAPTAANGKTNLTMPVVAIAQLALKIMNLVFPILAASRAVGEHRQRMVSGITISPKLEPLN